MKHVSKLAPGLLICVILGVAALLLGEISYVKDRLHLGPLLLAIVIGMLLRTMLRLPESMGPGISFAQKPVLRWAVAGLGFKLSLIELAKIGGPALAVIVLTTSVAIWFGYWISLRLGVSEKLAILIAIGGGICGASAIVAADSVVRSEKSETACALGTITLLGTIGILAYPLIGTLLGLTDFAYALWNGASLHEMAQVVAAGDSFRNGSATDWSIVAKLARICLLAPAVIGLAWLLSRRDHVDAEAKVAPVPWFLIVFVCFAALNSAFTIPRPVLDWILKVDLWLLCIGMAGVGLNSGFQDVRAAGIRPVIAGTIQWIVLAALALALACVIPVQVK